MPSIHLHDELAQTHERVAVKTRFGLVTGGRARNGAAVFLGKGLITDIMSICIRPDIILMLFRNTLCPSTG